MTYFFETYGCQMNVSESSGVEQLLKARGWKDAKVAESADLVLINTCSVRITAENRVFGRLGFYSALKRKTNIKILVMGCMAERLKKEFSERFPFVDYVVGISDRHELEEIFAAMEAKSDKVKSEIQSSNEKYLFAKTSYSEGAFQSFVPIMNGCNNFCTYCIVPYVRGREVSRSFEDIMEEISFLNEKAVREITLLGQNVNSYRGSLNGKELDFPDLLRLICAACEKAENIKWIRFLSSHPKDLSKKLIDVMASEALICKAIHLPVQHGSNRILKAMNRKYTVEHYLGLINSLREKMPNVAITTDILIGFPGETEEDVEETLRLMEKVEFNAAFMYHYNPREGTRAFELPNRIPEKIKIERLQRVIDLQHTISEKKMKEKLGTETMALLESQSKNNERELFGHTEAGEMFVVKNLDEKMIGQFVKLKLECIKGRTFVASVV